MKAAIKVCGITSVGDARIAVQCGAQYLGLIFVEDSARRVSPALACEIAGCIRGQAKLVGVFLNATAQQVDTTFSAVGLDFAQYHGEESPQFIASVGRPAIKVFELNSSFSWEHVMPYAQDVELLLFDRPKNLKSPDWLDSAVAKASSAPAYLPPYFFAGGLNPDNVGTVISKLRKPFFGVDVASGVESEPGVKDLKKLRLFCNVVNRKR